jgi:excinuclease ABC subunit C
LGRKVFVVEREDYESSDEAIAALIDGFYAVHLPREIRVSRPFLGRKELAQKLSLRFDREARINVANPAKKGINAFRGLLLSRDEHELDRARPRATPARIAGELGKKFGLLSKPRRVEAFDVAHISGTGFVAAWSVWDNGKFLSGDFGFEISPEQSELDALAAAVERRISAPVKPATLILLDGGKPQMNAVLKRLDTQTHRPPVIAAVKPKGRHSAVAAFITENGESHPFDIDSPAHAMLQLLRDEAHDLANRTHRDYREMMPFYEKAGFERPLVVPLRFHAENGGAEDLLPIDAR